MSATHRLHLDPATGNLWLAESAASDISDSDGRVRLLGHIDDPATVMRVPGELAGEWEVARGEWVEAVEYADECRATARAAYYSGRFA